MGPLGASGRDDDARRETFAAGLREAMSLWGPFELPPERFEEEATTRIRRRLERSGADATSEAVRGALARTSLPDLALAVACSDGASGSWDTLVGRLTPRLVGLAQARGASGAEARVLAADVLSEMSIPASGGRVRRLIDTYEGAGSLFGWAAVILVRRLHRARHRDAARAGHATAEATGRESRASHGADPAAVAAGAEAVASFRRALQAAWTALSGRERLALSWRYLDGIPQTRIATLLRVSEPHTSRIVTGAVARLRTGLERALGHEANGPEGAWPALVEVLRAQMVSARPVPPLPTGEAPPARGPR